MIKDHSNNERGNPLPPLVLLLISNKEWEIYSPVHFHCIDRRNLTLTLNTTLTLTLNLAQILDPEPNLKTNPKFKMGGVWMDILCKEGFNAPSTDRLVHTTAFVAPFVEYWLEWKMAKWKDQFDNPP